MRRLSLVLFVAVGVVGIWPDTADAGLIFRRRGRGNNCCTPCGGYGYGYGGSYGGGGCCGASYGGGYASSDCCGGGYAIAPYGGQPMVGYGPGAPYGQEGQPPYTAGYPNVGGGAQPMPSPSAPSVLIRDGAFEPNRINIRVGDTVRWTNDGAKVHTVTADDGSFDSGNLEPGKTFSRKFDKEGTFNYHCTPHKDQMKASVVVSQGAAGSVPGSPPPAPGGQPLPRDRDRDR